MSRQEWTPTTKQARTTFIFGHQMWHLRASGEPGITEEDAGAEFDRWLSEHDREVAARAWDEGHAVGHAAGQEEAYCYGVPEPTRNPYRKEAGV